MTTNAPQPLFIDDLSDSNNSFMVDGYAGYYARVQIRATFTGTATITVENPATSETLDSSTDTTTAHLFYILQNLTDAQYNVVEISAGAFTARALIEFFRFTSER